MNKKVVIVSGAFDPLHGGHLSLLKDASRIGTLIVALNSDDWIERKKNYHFMDWDERYEILKELCCVDMVIKFDDSDGTANKALEEIYNKFSDCDLYFANGGPRNKDNVPEVTTCKKLGIKMLWNVGVRKDFYKKIK